MDSKSIDISVAVPVYNERENVELLHRALKTALDPLGREYEIILVDDGSRDGTREVLRKIAEEDPRVRVILFRRNFGQSAAMAAGFKACQGKVIVAMDGDLQNDPADIPRLVERIESGYDVVSGWRKNRKDKLVLRKIPSRIANRLICSVTGVRLHDTGCSLKAFRAEVIHGIRLYGELHRFIPGLARVEGARLAEIEVAHHARRFGSSKYNLTRTFKVLMDLVSLNLFLKHLRSPIGFFGRVGLAFVSIGFVGFFWIAWRVLASGTPLMNLNVPLTAVFLSWAGGIQSFLMGFVASLIVRTGNRRGGTLAADVFKTDGTVHA